MKTKVKSGKNIAKPRVKGIQKRKEKLKNKRKLKKLKQTNTQLQAFKNESITEITKKPKKEAKVTLKSALKRKNNENPETSPKKSKKNNKNDVTEANVQETEEKSITWDDEDVLERTLFVGNVPVETQVKEIEKMFSVYGKIVTIRLRGIIPADPKVPKKVAAITKQINPNVKSIHCFIVFSSKDEVSKALVANGTELNGHHLRVDFAKPKDIDNSRNGIFLGNLPFNVQEDDIWKVFEDCGKIEYVRIVRDNATGIGKGFGYVMFDNPDSVELAMQLDTTIGNRVPRIKRINAGGINKTPEGTKIRNTPRELRQEAEKKPKKKSQKSNFQGAKFKTKKKDKKKNKGELQKKKISKMLKK